MNKQRLAEVVYFVNAQEGILRELPFSEFEAILDGLVGVQEFANSEQFAVFAHINSDLHIVSCVMFRVPFDEAGVPPNDWNLPFVQLNASAGKGPDLGAGPIKLSTASQCSVPWHQVKLWDATEMSDVFTWIREAALANRLDLSFDTSEQNTFSDSNDIMGEFDLSGDSIIETVDSPFLGNNHDHYPPLGAPAHQGQHAMPSYPHDGRHGGYMGYHAPMMPPIPYGYEASQPAPPGYYPPPLMHPTQHAARESAAEARLQQVMNAFKQKEQHYVEKIKQLQHHQKQELQNQLQHAHQQMHKQMQQQKERFDARLLGVKREYEQTLEKASAELKQWRTHCDEVVAQKNAAEALSASQKFQINQLTENLEQLRKASVDRERESAESVRAEYERMLRAKDQEMSERLKEKEAEITYRQEVVKQLRKDITLLRRDKIRLMNSGADKFLERLEELGISFIAFHPGAGHISISLRDMSSYIENPIGYASHRCLVSEEQYRSWLEHYENPVCQYILNEDTHEICGCKVRRTDVPSDFKSGLNDRCDKHRSLVAGWDNVVNIGG